MHGLQSQVHPSDLLVESAIMSSSRAAHLCTEYAEGGSSQGHSKDMSQRYVYLFVFTVIDVSIVLAKPITRPSEGCFDFCELF